MNSKIFIVVCVNWFLSVTASNRNQNQFKIVETNNGPVRGKLNQTWPNQMPFYSFRGVPFAKPPIGDLRFKAPEEIDTPRSGVLDAFEYSYACSQRNSEDSPIYSEDCLYLNIFVPVVENRGEKLGVFFYIFGGGWLIGSGDDSVIGPDFLMERGIILVTSNHRLGILGFMSLGTPEYSGNMGFKDQQLALKWIYENIEYFGGDRNRITLSGHSSGSVSASYHLISEESRRYFQQIMCFSGTSNKAATFCDDNHQCVMDFFAKNNSQSFDNVEDLVEYLKSVPEEILIDFTWDASTYMCWSALIESPDAVRPFLTQNPQIIWDNMDSINITAYYSYTSREMLTFIDMDYFEEVDIFWDDFYLYIPLHGYDMSLSRRPYMHDLMNEVKDFFLENSTDTFERMDRRIAMDSNMRMVYFSEKAVQKHIQVSSKNTFYSRFAVDTYMNHSKSVSFPGTAHGDELCYFFRCKRYADIYKFARDTRTTDPMSSIIMNTIDYMTALISNFVKFGHPTINGLPFSGFEPVRANEINYLDITNTGLFNRKAGNNRWVNFMDYFLNEIVRLIEENDDHPTETFIAMLCDELDLSS